MIIPITRFFNMIDCYLDRYLTCDVNNNIVQWPVRLIWTWLVYSLINIYSFSLYLNIQVKYVLLSFVIENIQWTGDLFWSIIVFYWMNHCPLDYSISLINNIKHLRLLFAHWDQNHFVCSIIYIIFFKILISGFVKA